MMYEKKIGHSHHGLQKPVMPPLRNLDSIWDYRSDRSEYVDQPFKTKERYPSKKSFVINAMPADTTHGIVDYPMGVRKMFLSSTKI